MSRLWPQRAFLKSVKQPNRQRAADAARHQTIEAFVIALGHGDID